MIVPGTSAVQVCKSTAWLKESQPPSPNELLWNQMLNELKKCSVSRILTL